MKTKRDLANSIWILCLVIALMPGGASAWPIFSYGDNDELRINHPLDNEQRKLLSRKIKILHLDVGADRNILDDPKLFPKLAIVTLADEINDHFLNSLSCNHTSIGALCITQTAPLSTQSMSYLRSFRTLKALELHCKTAEPQSAMPFIPNGIDFLWIEQPLTLPTLPKLLHLTIANCSIGAPFLMGLDTPRLKYLNLSSAEIEDNAFKALGKFPQLEYLDLPRTYDKRRVEVSQLTHAHIHVEGDPLGPPIQLVAPLRPLPQNE